MRISLFLLRKEPRGINREGGRGAQMAMERRATRQQEIPPSARTLCAGPHVSAIHYAKIWELNRRAFDEPHAEA